MEHTLLLYLLYGQAFELCTELYANKITTLKKFKSKEFYFNNDSMTYRQE